MARAHGDDGGPAPAGANGSSYSHGRGVLLTLAAVLGASWTALAATYTGSCGQEPTAGEIAELRWTLLAITVGFACVPTGLALWARRAGRAPMVWAGFAVLSVLVGLAVTAQAEPTYLFCF
jgi:hypothetical protein